MFFAFIGFLLGKTKLLNDTHTKALSVLCVYFFVPCSVFKTFALKFTTEYVKTNYVLLLDSICILTIVVVLSNLIAHFMTRNRYEQKVFSYSLTIPNYGYMGYALAAAFMGNEGLMDVMIFCLPMSLYVYTFGFSSLTNAKLSWKKLVNPVFITTLIGILFGLCAIPVPEMILNIANQGAGCMGPVSMLLLGLTLSDIQLKEMVSDIHVYEVSVLRLIVIPVLLWFALNAVFDKHIATVATFVYAMPCGLNTVVYPKLIGESCKAGTSLAFVSNILSCLTIPIILLLVGI